MEVTLPQSPTNKTIDISANTLKNSTNTAGHFLRNNGTQYIDGIISPSDISGTTITVPNETITGTSPNTLIALTGAPSVAIGAPAGSSSGVVGVIISGAGTTGNATIQISGIASCRFNTAAIAGDYVQIDLQVAGNCRDVGSSYPVSGQVIGRVLSTIGAGQVVPIDIFGQEVKSSIAFPGCVNATPVTVSNTGALSSLLSCTIPANSLSAGSLIAIDLTGIESTASAMTVSLQTSLGGGAVCPATSGTTSVVNNVPFYFFTKFSVITSGVSGTANMACGYSSLSSGGGVTGGVGVVGSPTISINTTVSNTLLVQVTMSVVNVGNSVTGQLLKAVIF